MSEMQSNIAFHGVDLRPLDRQRPDGVCEKIHNLRPAGIKDSPYWKPVPGAVPIDSGNENLAKASGSIRISGNAAPNPEKQAQTTLRVLSTSPAGPSQALFMITGFPMQASSITLTFSSLPAGNGAYSTSYNVMSSPQQVVQNLYAAMTANSGLMSAINVETVLINGLHGLRFTSVATGTATNDYEVALAHGDSPALITANLQDFEGGTEAGETFRVAVDGVETDDIVINSGNNTISGIKNAIKAAITSDIAGWEGIDGVTEDMVIIRSTAATSQQSDNFKEVTATNQKLELSEPAQTSGGRNGRDDWGTITISFPDAGFDVTTAVIDLEEAQSSIVTKITTALAAKTEFTDEYETYTPPAVESGGIYIRAKEPGPQFNTRLELEKADGAFNHTLQNISGGFDIIGEGKTYAAGWYRRNNRGDMSIDPTGSLKRKVILQNNRLAIVDPDKDNKVTFVHPLSDSTGRIATFAQTDDILMIGLRKDDKPEATYLLIDDVFLPFALPELPDFDLDSKTRTFKEEQDRFGLDPGYYCVRIAWRFKDGKHSALSVPRIIGLDREDGDGKSFFEAGIRHIVTVTLEGYETKPELYHQLDKVLDGVAVFISPATRYTRPFDGNVTGPRASGAQSGEPSDSDAYLATASRFKEGESEVSRSAVDGVYYDFGTIDKTDGRIDIDMRTEQIFTLPNADESSLIGHHRFACSIAGSYNKRALMGDTFVDFDSPDKHAKITFGDDDRSDISLRFAVGIESAGKEYIRISEPFTCDKTQIMIPSLISYPDRRANWIELWGLYGSEWKRLLVQVETGRVRNKDEDVSTSKSFARLELTAAERANFAFYIAAFNTRFGFKPIYWNVPDSAPQYPNGTPDVSFYDLSENVNTDYRPTRFFATELQNPFVLPAAQTYYVHAPADDPIQAFSVNALPISQGQFGQYPLYVFTKKSITALEQVGDAAIAFGRKSPVSSRLGCVGPYAVTNIGRGIMFIDESGVYQLPGNLNEPLSEPIDPALSGYSDNATIGYLHEGDNREVWISSTSEGAETWCFSLTRGRWFSVEGNRTQFYDDGRKLYAVNAANNLQRESAGTDAVTVHIKTGRLHLGQVDKRKRVWGTVIKWRIQGETLPAVQFYGEGHELLPADYRADRFRNAYGSMLYYALEIQGDIVQGDWIQSFDIKHERRLEHRLLQV